MGDARRAQDLAGAGAPGKGCRGGRIPAGGALELVPVAPGQTGAEPSAYESADRVLAPTEEPKGP